MKLLKKIRKGFTLIELVVVIAVIAILAAVSVVSYVSITNKAKQSNDQQKIDQVNLSAASAEISGRPDTMFDALRNVEEDGFKPENFKAEAKNYEFAYSYSANRFVILEKGEKVVYPKDLERSSEKCDIWRFASENKDVKTDGYSYYLLNGVSGNVTVAGGVDVGENQDIEKITYSSGAEQSVVIRGGGEQNTLEVNGKLSDVSFYGFTTLVDVKEVKDASLHVYGTVKSLSVTKGHVEVEQTGKVFEVTDIGTSGSVTNSGYIAKNSSESTIPGTAVGGDYKIYNLGDFEAFRDAVNTGANNYSDVGEIKLMADIELKKGWNPIGKGGRFGLETKPFSGTFNGNNHIISNLNNEGYRPELDNAIYQDSEHGASYAYGLFGLVKNATIKNLALTDVNISIPSSGAKGDSVGALAGFSQGNLTVEKVSVRSGSIAAYDSCGGLVGRAYDDKANNASVAFTSCSNAANITSTKKSAGVLGYASLESGSKKTISVVMTKCSNSGNITVSSQIVAGIVSSSDISLSCSECSNTGTVGTVAAKAPIAGMFGLAAKATGITVSYVAWGSSSYAGLFSGDFTYAAGTGIKIS